MDKRSLSPSRFRRRSRGQSVSYSVDDILFPKQYENAWEGGLGDQTDLEKARVFLMRFTRMNSDPMINTELQAIIMNAQNRSVPALAAAIQTRIYGNRHATFASTPLLQYVRFMLIKARIPEVMFSEKTRQIIDFYFDPSIAKNLEPLPEDPIVYKYPAGRLRVAIVGGGPTALSSAISLAEKGAGKVEVHMYEKRWVQYTGPQGTYIDYPPDAKRRDQVVTLQDSVTSLMTPATYQALFQGRPERVWPGSANIQIRKVEDRLLQRCQAPEFNGLIHLHTRGLEREDLPRIGDFHVLLGADGAASWVRKSYFQGYEKERGKSFALGLAFNRPAGLPWPQPLNVFLTLGQTRYLLNASDFDGRGYLNMQLTEEEWHQMVSVDGQPVTFGHPGCLRQPDGTIPPGFDPSQVFAPSEHRETALWKSIEDGLKLFGFKESEVINVVRIPIVVQAVREGVHHLPPQDARAVNRPRALVAVAGDAAMTVHFWPGRGLNSGIKAGIALGDELVHALNNGRFVGLPLDAMKEYNDFILKLQGREHDKRSIPILNQSGSPEMLGWLLGKAHTVPDNVAIEWLVGAMTQIAQRLEGRPDWSYETVTNLEPQLRIVLRQLDSVTLKEMAVSFPWPTREMAGAEVLPIRSMKPEEKERWVQQLWRMVRDERHKELSFSRLSSHFGGGGNARPQSLTPGRFEAPQRVSVDLSGSNALRPTSSHVEQNLAVPGAQEESERPSSSSGEVTLGRLLSVRRPNGAVLADAMSLALFRVDAVEA